MKEKKLIICDFDGTLVDTFEPNYLGYRDAFDSLGLELKESTYRQCFGMRFDGFMDAIGIDDPALRQEIRDRKTAYYPRYFDKLKVNKRLLEMVRKARKDGVITAIASTARVENLMNALSYINATADFDLILAGEQVKRGKPDPEIYLTVLDKTGVDPSEALIYEDSEVGLAAAEAAGVRYVKVDKSWFA